ncbi:hypothetical protein ACSSNL_06325 [Thalassobius sp. S69A]|uniref:hypothetical protein n=1 Tax=unclassified Thalassovita TaxID=2619711 RepID=UPI000C119700|nr:hypothetical protein [Paracoccaceae bacterium]
MDPIQNEAQSKAPSSTDRPEMVLEKWLIYATGAVAAVVLNALSGSGDHPHLAAMLIRWFAAIPLLMAGIYYAGLVYFRRYKIPEPLEVDRRPKWMISVVDYLANKTPENMKTVIVWSTETYLLVFMLAVSGLCLLLGWALLADGFELFNRVNSLLYQQQLDSLTP